MTATAAAELNRLEELDADLYPRKRRTLSEAIAYAEQQGYVMVLYTEAGVDTEYRKNRETGQWKGKVSARHADPA
jgi:hypothetical protein